MEISRRILEAYERIKADIQRTPVDFSPALSRVSGARVYLKWESEQVTGSFKLRGALNKVRALPPDLRKKGIVSASTGNHGLAIGHAARLEGLSVRLFLPETVAEVKRKKLEAMGVQLEVYGSSCEKAEKWAREFAEGRGLVYISPYNDLEVVAGQGTAGLEIVEDIPDVEDVLIPLGGGGLAAGIAGWLKSAKPGLRAFGVEPDGSAFMRASFEAGRIVEVEERETIADAVAGGIEPGSVTYPLCRKYLDGIMTVAEASIAAAMALLYRAHGRIVEGAGALGPAALLKAPSLFQGRTVVCVVSGGNIDTARFQKIVEGARPD